MAFLLLDGKVHGTSPSAAGKAFVATRKGFPMSRS
jgi:hypothetical protein